MTLLEAHAAIIQAAAIGIPELIYEAIETHKSEMRKRGRQTGNYSYWVGVAKDMEKER